MKLKAVIFDLYGTLVDMYSFKENKCLQEMAGNLEAPLLEFAQAWLDSYDQRELGQFPTVKASIEAVCTMIGVATDSAKIMKATKTLLDFTYQTLIPRPEAIETLKYLKKEGYRTGLISGCSMEVPLVWSSTQFASLIDVPIFSCQIGLNKPDPRVYQEACKQLKVTSEECLYIGDGSKSELRGALEVGMRPALIRIESDWKFDAYRDLADWKGPVIHSLKEVKRLLAS